MNATVTEIIGVFSALVVVAGVSFAIANGGNTAKVVGAVTGGFANSIRAATMR